MGKYQRFDEVPVWQEAARLYERVLDLLEEPNVPLSATFRNQLERASLCVSSTVAEGFEVSPGDSVPLLRIARGAAVEVQSLVALISERPKLTRLREPFQQIRASAESCTRQLGAWKSSIENPAQGKRQASEGEGSFRSAAGKPQGGGRAGPSSRASTMPSSSGGGR